MNCWMLFIRNELMSVLNRIEIDGLFDHYSYVLPLKAGKRKDICFMTGPNGYGKSTILRLIDAFMRGDAKVLSDIPFKRIVFYLNKYKVVVVQERLEGAGDAEAEESENDDELPISVRMTIALYTIDGERMIESCTFDDSEIGSAKLPIFPPTLSVYLASLKVEYIRDDRLLPRNADRPSITSCIAVMQNLMAKYDEHLSAIFNMLLLDAIRKNKPAEMTIDETAATSLYKRALQKLASFNKVGLATKLIDDETVDDDHYLKLMQMMALDAVLSYDDIVYKRLSTLYEVIERAEFSDKQLKMDARYGLYFVGGDTIVIPENLSSGEQHFIVQVITLLIKANPGSLILIDEPELSLHPAWQMDYLKMLQRIAQIGGYQFILATHSPQIFDYHWSFTIDLYKQTTDDAEGTERND